MPRDGGVMASHLNKFKSLQPSNAELPIEVTELPIVTDVKPKHQRNALSPIEVTELGMVIDVKPRHQ